MSGFQWAHVVIGFFQVMDGFLVGSNEITQYAGWVGLSLGALQVGLVYLNSKLPDN